MLGFSPLGAAPLGGSIRVRAVPPPAPRLAQITDTSPRSATLADTGRRVVSIL